MLSFQRKCKTIDDTREQKSRHEYHYNLTVYILHKHKRLDGQIPSQDLQQLSHSTEVLRFIHKPSPNRGETEQTDNVSNAIIHIV